MVQKFMRQISDLEDLTFSGRKRGSIRKGDVQFQHRANVIGISVDWGSGRQQG